MSEPRDVLRLLKEARAYITPRENWTTDVLYRTEDGTDASYLVGLEWRTDRKAWVTEVYRWGRRRFLAGAPVAACAYGVLGLVTPDDQWATGDAAQKRLNAVASARGYAGAPRLNNLAGHEATLSMFDGAIAELEAELEGAACVS